MTEKERIESISRNGGRHLQNFKEENITYAMCLTAVENDGTAIYMVPEKFRTEEVYMITCKTYGSILSRLPEKYMSKEICQVAVSSDGLAIEYVPDEYKDRDLYLLAASNNPLVMQKMPIDYMTVEFCTEVIKRYGKEAVASIPKSHKNGKFYLPLVELIPEIIWNIPKTGHTAAVSKAVVKGLGFQTTAEAVSQNPELLSQLHTSLYDHETCLTFCKSAFWKENAGKDSCGFNTDSDRDRGMLYLQNHYEDHYSLKHILRWTDVCEIVIPQLPCSLCYVKEDILSYSLCLTAVKANHRAFYDVPDRFKTEELCLIAFEHEPHHLERFPPELITHDLCLQGVKRSGYLLENIPDEFKSYEVCLEAVKSNGVLDKVPVSLMDEELCIQAIKCPRGIHFSILKNVPEHLRTYQVCLEAVKADSGSFEYVPEEHKTYELCLAAVKRSAFGIKSLPDDYFTEELCLELVAHTATNFKIIPKHRLTEKVCLLALSHGDRYGGTILSEIPKEMITQEMCDKAMERSIWSLKAVPSDMVTEEMLMYVAAVAPGRLNDNFPERFRTIDFVQKIVEKYPAAANYIVKYGLE